MKGILLVMFLSMTAVGRAVLHKRPAFAGVDISLCSAVQPTLFHMSVEVSISISCSSSNFSSKICSSVPANKVDCTSFLFF
jgi:hypothetical protein